MKSDLPWTKADLAYLLAALPLLAWLLVRLIGGAR